MVEFSFFMLPALGVKLERELEVKPSNVSNLHYTSYFRKMWHISDKSPDSTLKLSMKYKDETEWRVKIQFFLNMIFWEKVSFQFSQNFTEKGIKFLPQT